MQQERPATLGEIIEDNAHQFPHDLAVTYSDTRMTHRMFADRARSLASGFQQLGDLRQVRIALSEFYGRRELASYITATVQLVLAPVRRAAQVSWKLPSRGPAIKP